MKKNRIVMLSLVASIGALALGAGIALARPGALPTVAAEHGATCHFNHYEAVSPTKYSHGSREFWACCDHHEFLLSAPGEGEITDKGAFTGDYFDELEYTDERYVAPIVGVTLGWWSLTGKSGIDSTKSGQIDSAVQDFIDNEYDDTFVYSFKEFAQSLVGDLGTAINDDGEVDIFIGAAANLKSTGKVDYVERTGPLTINGAENRYIYLLTNTAAANAVYNYMVSNDGLAAMGITKAS